MRPETDRNKLESYSEEHVKLEQVIRTGYYM